MVSYNLSIARRFTVPWKECDKMSERIKFIARALDGERMTDLCKEFGISTKTGYKYLKRYKTEGISGLEEQPRIAKRVKHKLPQKIELLILEIKESYPSWGAPKIRERLTRKFNIQKPPAISTIHSVLERNNLVKKRKRKKNLKLEGTSLTVPKKPNELWCADHKGQFKLKNNKYCYPLTITDDYSRFLIECDASDSTLEKNAFNTFERAFEEYGLPDAIKTDNGVPFGASSYFGLSKLAVWWLRLGIRLERIRPGNPQENGRHERMHRTLKAEAVKPQHLNFLTQQESFDNFKEVYNQERPHQGINMKCPSDLYHPSKRKYKRILEELDYPSCEITRSIRNCGRIHLDGNKRVYIGVPFAGENVGLRKIEEKVWEVLFMTYKMVW